MNLYHWIMVRAASFFIFLIGSYKLEANDLKVLMLNDGSKPYAENASGDVLSTFNKAVLGQLLVTTDTFELQAGLLKNWKWSSKDGSYELFLRENLTFHDGTPVTSADLEFTLLRGFFSQKRSFYEIYLGNILGVDRIKPGTKFSTGLVEGVQITSLYSVKVKLKNPNPSFLYSLTRPYFSFSKRSSLNDDLITWKKWPVGAGLYKVVDENSEMITIEKREKKEKGIDRIFLYKIENPKVKYDVSFLKTQNLEIYDTKNPSAIYTLFYTNQNELSAIKEFRKAIYFGVNKTELIFDDKYSKAAYEFLPSTFWRNDEGKNEYDLEKAKVFFNKLPSNLREKVWKIPVYSFGELSERAKKVTDRLKAQFEKFGFKVEFYPSSEKFLSLETAKNTPISYSGRICNNVDPLLMFSSFKTISPYKYDNSQLDTKFDVLFEEASKSISTEDRVLTIRKLSKYTIENNFMLPLFENNQTYYYNTNTIKDFGVQNNAITLYLDEIKMK